MEQSELIKQIRSVFNQLDVDGSGTLSLEEMKTGMKMIDFGLGTSNESFAEELFQSLKSDSTSITVDDFIHWNLSKISNLILEGQEKSLGEIFISPAFQVLDKLTKIREHLTDALQEELDFCLSKIRSGKLYTPGSVGDMADKEIVLKPDTLSVMMFFSEGVKKKVLLEDENSAMDLAQNRSTSAEDCFLAEIQDLTDLISIESLDFDIFKTHKAIGSVTRLVHAVLDKCMKEWDIYRNLSVNYSNFMLFSYEISLGYSEANPYHNNLHAGDVVQNLGYLLTTTEAILVLDLRPLHIFALLVAGLVHDYKHPGVTNAYLEATSHNIALRYNDRSVLENYHVSEAFSVMKTAEYDIFEHLDPSEYRTARHIITESVLNTDMAKHNACVGSLQTLLLSGNELSEHKILGLSLMLHAADISHPCRPWSLHEKWTGMVQEEFFAQGDKEKRAGLKVTSLFDRETMNRVPTLQIGFINGVLLPLYKPLCQVLHGKGEIIKNIENNRTKWAEYR